MKCTALVHEKAGRRQRDLTPGFGDRTGVVNGHVKRQLARLRKVDNVAGWIVCHGNRHHAVAFALVLFVGLRHLRHLGYASRAAGRPKIHQGDTAEQVFRLQLATIQQNKGRRGCTLFARRQKSD